MGSMSLWHWVIVIAVVLLLFGRGKISELMGDVAHGIKAFKKGMTEEEAAKAESGPARTGQDDRSSGGERRPDLRPAAGRAPQGELSAGSIADAGLIGARRHSRFRILQS